MLTPTPHFSLDNETCYIDPSFLKGRQAGRENMNIRKVDSTSRSCFLVVVWDFHLVMGESHGQLGFLGHMCHGQKSQYWGWSSHLLIGILIMGVYIHI